MKKLLILSVGLFMMLAVRAQFTRASLQATGLTCAMCSNAINKALQRVPFIDKVMVDIKNSIYNIHFKPGVPVDIDALKDAVTDAGFSVGSLKLSGSFNQVKIANDTHVKIGNDEFHFLDIKDQVLNGDQTLTVVDKNFVSAKQFKKFSAATKMGCVQTGKAAACCTKEGLPAGSRIYHVTI